MNIWLLLGYFVLSGSHLASHWTAGAPLKLLSADEDAKKLSLVMRCQSETSPWVRLDCYDHALAPGILEDAHRVNAGPGWQRAINQEKNRTDHSTHFLITERQGLHPIVVITTPAIGVPPPRPVLMLSCIDNITRLQVALTVPQRQGAKIVTLDKTRTEVQWFIRENGYLLESSRGLAGIDEIKRLMATETLSIEGSTGALSRLTFNISQLSQALKPLRLACHW